MGNPTKLVPDNQLILDAPLLKVPLELIRRNFKSAQRNIDKETKAITASLNEAAQKAQLGRASPEETIASIDSMVKRMQTLKRKVCSVFLFFCPRSSSS
jgi:macrophage erythroblast attacher